jgi:aminoglycoside phosphotransferase (APT) family kinase protein
MDVAELTDRLRAFIQEQGNFAEVKIVNLHKMPGGASREIWSFDCIMKSARGSETRGMVLRRDPGAQRIDTNRRSEFLVLRAAFKEGVPVPEVFWVSSDPAVLEADFFIMQRVEGETIARRLLRDEQYATARKLMPAQLAEIAARIHRIDPVKHKLDFLPEPGPSAALTEVQRYEENFRTLAQQPYPAFELAFRWLYQRVPKSPRKMLVHGDYRIGNIIFGPEGVRSILDWELAHLGDPMEDLGWMCARAWRFGADENPVGGLGQREDFWAAYEKASGISVDPEAARWWEVFGNLKWGIITISQARTHLDGMVSSVELASIGRRTVENELELLNLIEEEDRAA